MKPRERESMPRHIDESRFAGRLPPWPPHDASEEEAALRVIRSGRWGRGEGEEVDRLEAELAGFIGVDHVRAVTNGTHALELGLACLGIQPGDEVVVPACTFISTGSSVLNRGAVPVPVDVDPDTLCIDAEQIEAAVTPRTRAILPVHFAGNVCDMAAIKKIAARHGLSVMEDAAHALGATRSGERAGAIGRCAIFSFQSKKHITAGEGGAFCTSDPALAEQTYPRHSIGRPQGDPGYTHLMLASNLRMSEIHAALLRAQLARLPRHIAQREKGAAHLDRLFARVPGVRPLVRQPGVEIHSRYMYMMWLDPEVFRERDAGAVAQALREAGIPANVCYPPLHKTPMFSRESLEAEGFSLSRGHPLPDYAGLSLLVSEAASRETVWLHHSVLLADETLLEEIADEIAQLQKRPAGTSRAS